MGGRLCRRRLLVVPLLVLGVLLQDRVLPLARLDLQLLLDNLLTPLDVSGQRRRVVAVTDPRQVLVVGSAVRPIGGVLGHFLDLSDEKFGLTLTLYFILSLLTTTRSGELT